ncbi:AAA family ATPase [Caballeronia mineralivorans]|uniref:AAA family ATPase n=1 Tax=Caballeronia mineralivorans TaxID=2010198 RepID=UPI0023F2A2D1|nr:AAA family ATPase [Caballeronia mineralivorans]MDB5789795.1 hypothetical protein [Caballeronia mineralivorans]
MTDTGLAIRKIVIDKSGGCLREGVWENVPLFAVVTGENGTGKSQLLHALGKSLGAQVDPVMTRGVAPAPPYGDARVTFQGVSFTGGSVFYSPSAWTLNSGFGVAEQTFHQRVNELHQRPAQSLSSGNVAEWQSDPAYAAFVVEETSLPPRITFIPSLAEFRDGLTPRHIAAPSFYAPTQFNLSMYFFAYEMLSGNLRVKGVSEAEIKSRFGEAPWDVLNEILAAASLSFRVTAPARIIPSVFTDTSRQYQLSFVDEKTGNVFPFEALSSGEKVIVSTLLWRLTAESTGSHFQLLLLDEPDAHLHPSMVKRFLSVIDNVFVKARGVGVVMTSHSPTTVALAPAGSIFILDKDAGGIPRKAEKDEALRRLTSGVPALSIAYEHRRQVFVESPPDAEFYEQIYIAHRDRFSPEISLEFIAVGRNKGGGCAQVKYIVEKLVAAGNPWVYGLIDKDNGQPETDRVRVAGNKYSIENYLFDPLVLAVHLRRLNLLQDPIFIDLMNGPYWNIVVGPSEVVERVCSYVSDMLLGALSKMNMCLIENKVASAERPKCDEIVEWAKDAFTVIDGSFVDGGEQIVVEYAGGMKVAQPLWLSSMRGHDLEYLARQTFQDLKSHKNHPAGSMRQTLLRDMPALAPADVLSTLVGIQSQFHGAQA